jgi:hypothetical protein
MAMPSTATTTNMKTNKLIISLSAVLLGVCVAGCDGQKQPADPGTPPKSETATPDAAATLKTAADQAVDTVKQTATAVTDQAKATATAAATEVKQVANQTVEQAKTAAATATAEAQKTVESAKTTLANTLSAATNQAATNTVVTAVTNTAQVWIDKAKALITEKKYQDALASLQQLTGYQLTPEQQKTVTDLKATIQSALGSDAAKAMEGWLKK